MYDTDRPTALADDVADWAVEQIAHVEKTWLHDWSGREVILNVLHVEHVDQGWSEIVLSDGDKVWRVEVRAEGEAEELTGDEAAEYLAVP